MIKSLFNKAKKWLKRAAVIGTAIFALSSPAKAQEARQETEPQAITYVIEEGDHLTKIAEQQLIQEGYSPTLKEVIDEANRIARLNGKARVQEYPFHEEDKGRYDCAAAPREDPNCIYPGDQLMLEKEVESTAIASDKSPASNEYNYNLLMYGLGVLTGLAGCYLLGKNKEEKNRKEYLESLVGVKNDNSYHSLDNLVQKTDNDLLRNGDDLKTAYKEFFEQYSKGLTPEGLMIERYDHSIAPEEMKMEMIKQYKESDKSLDAVARDLSIKYGMNVSRTTVSRYGRQAHGVNSRKEAKESEPVKKAA